jgi:hypothetical protein
MRYVVAFFRFWYDFIVGDDRRIAAGVVGVLALAGVTVALGVASEWLGPVVAVALVAVFSAAVLRFREA